MPTNVIFSGHVWVAGWLGGWGKAGKKANLSQLELTIGWAWQKSNIFPVSRFIFEKIFYPGLCFLILFSTAKCSGLIISGRFLNKLIRQTVTLFIELTCCKDLLPGSAQLKWVYMIWYLMGNPHKGFLYPRANMISWDSSRPLLSSFIPHDYLNPN